MSRSLFFKERYSECQGDQIFSDLKKPALELRRSPKQINCFVNVGGSFNCKYILSDTRLAMPVYSGNEVAKVKFNLARKN